jgi:phage protein D
VFRITFAKPRIRPYLGSSCCFFSQLQKKKKEKKRKRKKEKKRTEKVKKKRKKEKEQEKEKKNRKRTLAQEEISMWIRDLPGDFAKRCAAERTSWLFHFLRGALSEACPRAIARRGVEIRDFGDPVRGAECERVPARQNDERAFAKVILRQSGLHDKVHNIFPLAHELVGA